MTITVKAKGDGNCAFNAYALSLCHLIISGKLDDDFDRQETIINIFQEALPQSGIREASDKWQKIKDTLALYRVSDEQLIRNNIESPLANELRKQISTFALTQSPKYIEKTEEALAGAFDQYCQIKNGHNSQQNQRNPDDIFVVHPFILTKFEQLRLTNHDDDTKTSSLQDWWENGAVKDSNLKPYEFFNEQMQKNGSNAGDVEIGILNDILKLGLKINRNNNPMDYSTNENADSPKVMLRHNNNGHWDCEIEDDNHQAWLKPLFKNAASSSHSSSSTSQSNPFLFNSASSPTPFFSFSSSSSSTSIPYFNLPPFPNFHFPFATTTPTGSAPFQPALFNTSFTNASQQTQTTPQNISANPVPVEAQKQEQEQDQTAPIHVNLSTAAVENTPSEPQNPDQNIPEIPVSVQQPPTVQVQQTPIASPVHPVAQQGLFSSRPKTTTPKRSENKTPDIHPVRELRKSTSSIPPKSEPSKPAETENKIGVRVVEEATKAELKKIFENKESVKDCHFDNWPAKVTYKSDEIKIDQIEKTSAEKNNVIVFTTKSNNPETLKLMIDGAKQVATDSIHDDGNWEIEFSIKDKAVRDQLIQYCKQKNIPYKDITPKNIESPKSTEDSAAETSAASRNRVA